MVELYLFFRKKQDTIKCKKSKYLIFFLFILLPIVYNFTLSNRE